VAAVLRFRDVTVRRDGRNILDHITWTVAAGERWVVLGPNGAGKTTLMLIGVARLFPTSGSAEILGEELGSVAVGELRTQIGWASGAHAADFPRGEAVVDVIVTGAHAVTGRWREAYDESDHDRARELAATWGLGLLERRTFGTLSEGERKRTLIARSLMADPELLVLDEPGAGLDLGGREDLVAHLARLAADPSAPALILVTHHVEEIPPGFTHVLLLADGRAVAAGPIGETLTDDALTRAFGQPLTVRREDGRWYARRARA
jgi:iron complex transport system ATP-binding protein